MADAVTSQTIQDGDRTVVMKFTNVSDGSGESAVAKVDVSALQTSSYNQTCTGVAIERIWWQCIGMRVQMLWDATSNVICLELGENQSGDSDFSTFGGLTNNSGSGKTGDLLFTTVGHTSGDSYSIILQLNKSFT
tara:strand:+ start:103 stop:507 length:405 start_codon:yes stop_codon:yes gene_type:complete